MPTGIRKVIVLGLDGFDPRRAMALMDRGQLPALAKLRGTGGATTLATTFPAQTPVAWSTFATGVNPGGHGIFDFIRRDPKRYFPELTFSRHEQRSVLLPATAVNIRSGQTIWERLSQAGVPSVVLRCPCTYPPERFTGKLLAGMGVPDLRGGVGTSTVLVAELAGRVEREGEAVTQLQRHGPGWRGTLRGPQRTAGEPPMTLELEITPHEESGDASVLVRQQGGDQAVAVREGGWSEWLRVRFSAGMLTRVAGLVRVFLVRRDPVCLYVSPVNFDPAAPLFPISQPWSYAGDLQRELGPYYTAGFCEDHAGLENGWLSEGDFLAQCEDVMRERSSMLHHELHRLDAGLLFCLFDTPDRLQHMFWRYNQDGSVWGHVIDDHYRACDAVVASVLGAVDDRTLLIVLSDHGFGPFTRGVNLNAWLHARGWLALRAGCDPSDPADFLRYVDWTATRAYALGMGAVYLNVSGREGEGIVPPGEAPALARTLARELASVEDPHSGGRVVRRAITGAALYRGDRVSEAPDVVVGFESGYRVSWGTVLGGIGGSLVEPNTRKWSGDHIVDPELVPGLLAMNRPFLGAPEPRMVDLAPTILGALGVAPGAHLEGRSLLA